MFVEIRQCIEPALTLLAIGGRSLMSILCMDSELIVGVESKVTVSTEFPYINNMLATNVIVQLIV